jgi:hypothetical protein
MVPQEKPKTPIDQLNILICSIPLALSTTSSLTKMHLCLNSEIAINKSKFFTSVVYSAAVMAVKTVGFREISYFL